MILPRGRGFRARGEIMKNIRNTCDKTNAARLQLLYRRVRHPEAHTFVTHPFRGWKTMRSTYPGRVSRRRASYTRRSVRNRWLAISFGIQRRTESVAAPETWLELHTRHYKQQKIFKSYDHYPHAVTYVHYLTHCFPRVLPTRGNLITIPRMN